MRQFLHICSKGMKTSNKNHNDVIPLSNVDSLFTAR